MNWIIVLIRAKCWMAVEHIILFGKSHISSLRPFRMTAGKAAFTAIPICYERGVHMCQFHVVLFILSFHLQYLKRVLEIFHLSLKVCCMCHTCSLHIPVSYF